jgi:hypothetical protein
LHAASSTFGAFEAAAFAFAAEPSPCWDGGTVVDAITGVDARHEIGRVRMNDASEACISSC